jgi:hypothetical protein
VWPRPVVSDRLTAHRVAAADCASDTGLSQPEHTMSRDGGRDRGWSGPLAARSDPVYAAMTMPPRSGPALILNYRGACPKVTVTGGGAPHLAGKRGHRDRRIFPRQTTRATRSPDSGLGAQPSRAGWLHGRPDEYRPVLSSSRYADLAADLFCERLIRTPPTDANPTSNRPIEAGSGTEVLIVSCE